MAVLHEKWRITLLNGIAVSGSGRRIERFRSQTTGDLLVLLVLNSHRFMPREEIAGIIWPDSPVESGRASLRTALSALRAVLEPIGTPANSVLRCNRVSARLAPESFTSDVLEFKSLSEDANRAEGRRALELTARAVHAYSGELAPGSYCEWIVSERSALSLAYTSLLARLVRLRRDERSVTGAIPDALKLLNDSPLDDAPAALAMMACLDAGSPQDALACFARHEEALRLESGESVSAQVRELANWARSAIECMSSATELPFQSAHPLPGPSPIVATPQAPEEPVARGRTIGLPLSLTRFFGRRREIAAIVEMLLPQVGLGHEDAVSRRLLTITGPGGAGKTRLAAEIAGEIAARGIDVYFVSLAEVREPARMLEEIARALDIAQCAPGELVHAVSRALANFTGVLALDNFEQLLPPTPEPSSGAVGASASDVAADAPTAIGAILRASPGLKCLVTSRQCLGLMGEQEYALEPLATPATDEAPEAVQEFDCVRLFLDRARLADPSFQLTPRSTPAIAGICRRLDGLPLSLELAAAWASSLSPWQIQERLSHGLDLLVGRKRDRHERHKSLRAALDWSHDLLPPLQRDALKALTVFTGGWDAEAAAWVCGGAGALESIVALQERSLVVADRAVSGEIRAPRYRFLETVRTYAAGRLDESERTLLRRRHLEWFDRLAEEAYRHWCTADEDAWHRRIALDQPNIVAALEFGIADSPASVRACMRILANLGHFWAVRAQHVGIEDIYTRYLAHPYAQRPDTLRQRVCYAAAGLACLRRDYRASEALYMETLNIARHLHKPAGGKVYLSLGGVAERLGDHCKARERYEEALRAYDRSGDRQGVASVHGALGGLYMEERSYLRARPELARAVELMQALGNLSGTTHHSKLLGLCYARTGDYPRAGVCLEQSMTGFLSLMDLRGLGELFEQMADAYPPTVKTATLMGAAQAINTAISAPLQIDPSDCELRRVLGNQEFDAAWHAGLALPPAHAAELVREVLREAAAAE
jgi:non-specific serine/threonine protein kinase